MKEYKFREFKGLKKVRKVKAWVVVVDNEICTREGTGLQIYTSKVLPNKYQKVIRCEVKFES